MEVRHGRRRKRHRLIMTRSAHVGELLFTAYVDRQIYLARILADNHPFVNRLAGTDEEYPALLQMEDRVGRRESFAVGDHRTVRARANSARPRRVPVEQRMHEALAASVLAKSAAKSNESAG